jgi:predicted metal-dependent peptidase
MQVVKRQQVMDSPGIREKVMAARIVAVERWPYFGPQVLSLVLIAKPGSGTCSTDCRGRLNYDPEFVENISVPELATVILHEALHNWLDHANRRQGRLPRKWNKAVDREINDDLASEDMPFPKAYPPLLPEQIGQPNGQLGEVYFEHEVDEEPEEGGDEPGGDEPGKGKGRRGGSSSDGVPRPWEDGPEDESDVPEIPESQQECIRHQVSENIIETSKNRGRVPSGLLIEAQKNLAPPKVSWQKEMSAAIRACAADIAGAVDFTYRRPSRRQSIYGDIVIPATRRPIPNTAIVLDTSGSMIGEDLQSALNETQGVLKALGGVGVRVLATDARVHTRQKVTHASKIEVLGGGGTDMRVGLAEAAKLRPNPDLCIVLTDGYTPWPDKAPKGMRVIIAVVGEYTRGIPKWARTVVIN